jgi:hypothetical protein
MNSLKAPEANFPTPLPKIRPRIVERIAEFDEHVQRHEQTEDVLAASIVNQASMATNAPPRGKAS